MSSMIETVNLKKTFGDHEVLRGISQHIEKGEKVVQRSISTRSGSGWGWSFSSSTCFR